MNGQTTLSQGCQGFYKQVNRLWWGHAWKVDLIQDSVMLSLKKKFVLKQVLLSNTKV